MKNRQTMKNSTIEIHLSVLIFVMSILAYPIFAVCLSIDFTIFYLYTQSIFSRLHTENTLSKDIPMKFIFSFIFAGTELIRDSENDETRYPRDGEDIVIFPFCFVLVCFVLVEYIQCLVFVYVFISIKSFFEK